MYRRTSGFSTHVMLLSLVLLCTNYFAMVWYGLTGHRLTIILWALQPEAGMQKHTQTDGQVQGQPTIDKTLALDVFLYPVITCQQ